MDNSLPAVDAMKTPISSVDQNFMTLGYRGAELLDQLMHGKPAPKQPVLIPPTGLIARKSSDLLNINHNGVAQGLRFMWNHCHEPIGVNDLAQAAAMSVRNFHKAFVKHVGRAPGAELYRIRIERAKKLLSDPKEKIESISAMCGYDNSNSFWVAFRRSTGLSPKQYQRQFIKT